MESETSPETRRTVWIARALLVAAFVVLERWTHGAWADLLVDFGQQFYVPWRLQSGAHLGREIAWLNGPLSPYWNALLLRVFGASLRTLTTANLILLAAGALLLHGMLRRLSGLFAATVAVLLFLALSGFGYLTALGNYNFAAPYSHDLVHGWWLALVSLAALFAWIDGRRLLPLALAGFAFGLCALTKAEVFAALAAAVVGTLVLDRFRRPGPQARSAFPLPIFAAVAALPVAGSVLALSTVLPLGDALRQTAGGWRWIARPVIANGVFYRHLAGLDTPGENLLRLATVALAWIAVGGTLVTLAFANRGGGARAARLAWAAVPPVVALVLWRFASADWHDVARPLPLVAAVSSVFFGARAWSHAGPGRRDLKIFGFSLFALALLARMPLATQLRHYGFVLAAPAIALAVLAWLHWIPAWIDGRGWNGRVFRAFAFAGLASWAIASLLVADSNLAERRSWIGSGVDALRVGASEAAFFSRIERRLDAQSAPGETLAVLPEGVLVNWLLHRFNPTPYFALMPPEVALFGESSIVAAFSRQPPDLLLIWNRLTVEYGVREFGAGYATRLAAWIDANYEALPPPGAAEEPVAGEPRFVLLRRRAPLGKPATSR